MKARRPPMVPVALQYKTIKHVPCACHSRLQAALTAGWGPGQRPARFVVLEIKHRPGKWWSRSVLQQICTNSAAPPAPVPLRPAGSPPNPQPPSAAGGVVCMRAVAACLQPSPYSAWVSDCACYVSERINSFYHSHS